MEPSPNIGRVNCARRGGVIFAATAAAIATASLGCSVICYLPELMARGTQGAPPLLVEYFRFVATVAPPLGLVGALLGWYYYEVLRREGQDGSSGLFILVGVPRAGFHVVFYGVVTIAVFLGMVLAAAPCMVFEKRVGWNPLERYSSVVSALVGGPVAFIFGPGRRSAEQEGPPAQPEDMRRCMRVLWPVPAAAMLLALALLVGDWRKSGGSPMGLWPWLAALTGWLGDYLVLWHVLACHSAGRLAPWSPWKFQFSLRALVLAVLAWGAYLTGLRWVWWE